MYKRQIFYYQGSINKNVSVSSGSFEKSDTFVTNEGSYFDRANLTDCKQLIGKRLSFYLNGDDREYVEQIVSIGNPIREIEPEPTDVYKRQVQP